MDELARVHDPAYLARLAAFLRRGRAATIDGRHLRVGGLVDGGPPRALGQAWPPCARSSSAGEGVAFVPVRPPGPRHR